MNDSGGVRGGERVGQRNRCLQQDRELERALAQPLLERFALEELHDDERLLLRGFADVVDGADVRVVQRGDRPCFTLKPLACQVGAGEPRRQHLDGDLAVEARVARAIDLAHAAGADGGDDLVPDRAECQRRRSFERLKREPRGDSIPVATMDPVTRSRPRNAHLPETSS